MKYYLSSFKFGKEKHQFKELAPTNRIAIIPNALDFRDVDSDRTRQSIKNKMLQLSKLGFDPEIVDLKDYFEHKYRLKHLIDTIGVVFILGGNVFVLRQAMKLSGLDEILLSHKNDHNFLYSGYSAAGCVLAPSLKQYKLVGDHTQAPYPDQDTILAGLGLADFAFMPHWDSDHPESLQIGEAIEYCKQHNIKYKALRDDDVLIF